MIALAVLTITTANANATQPSRVRISYPQRTDLIELTVPETRRLINIILARPITITAALTWSVWRRQHQAQAKASHYKRRALIESEQLTG